VPESVNFESAQSVDSSGAQTDVSGVNKNHKDCSGRRLQSESAAKESAAGTGAATGTSVRTEPDECAQSDPDMGKVVGIVIGANAFVCIVICLVMYLRRDKFWANVEEKPIENAGAEKKVEEPITIGIDESKLAGN